MKKAPSLTSLSNVHSETQKIQRQNANILCSRSVRCLLSHVVVEFPNSRHMYALLTYLFLQRDYVSLNCDQTEMDLVSSLTLEKSSSLLENQ